MTDTPGIFRKEADYRGGPAGIRVLLTPVGWQEHYGVKESRTLTAPAGMIHDGASIPIFLSFLNGSSVQLAATLHDAAYRFQRWDAPGSDAQTLKSPSGDEMTRSEADRIIREASRACQLRAREPGCDACLHNRADCSHCLVDLATCPNPRRTLPKSEICPACGHQQLSTLTVSTLRVTHFLQRWVIWGGLRVAGGFAWHSSPKKEAHFNYDVLAEISDILNALRLTEEMALNRHEVEQNVTAARESSTTDRASAG